MITKMPISHTKEMVQEALYAIFHEGFDFVLNEQTGDFFYDPWVLKEKYQGTVWQTIIESLPSNIGEARIRKLDAGEAYIGHADIDNRFHLNLSGEQCYIIDLKTSTMYPTVADGFWYTMDAGSKHTAANFGNRVRFQLVVRQLLTNPKLKDPVDITIQPTITDLNEARYVFDDTISVWLNWANKNKILNDFKYGTDISFKLEKIFLDEFTNILPKEFKIL